MNILFSILTAFFLGFLSMPILIYGFQKLKLVDEPGGRKIHSNATPSMGGIVIVLSILITSLVWLNHSDLFEIRYMLASLALMFFVGLRDDLVVLSPIQKLLGQFVASLLVVVMADIRISGLYGFLGIYELPILLSYLLSIIVLIALTNSFNLIDGLDGLAGTMSLLTFVFLGWWFHSIGFESYGLYSLIVGASVLSFLIFNWYPAKIFMGDTGSLSLGFVLAVLTILFIDSNGKLPETSPWKFNAPIASGIAIMIVPIYDTIRVFARRIRRRKSPFLPDKSHVHHFLARTGLTHDKVVFTLGGIKIFFIGIIFLGAEFSDYIMLPIVIFMAVSLGYRLDAYTLKKLKQNYRKSPPILNGKNIKANHKTKLKDELKEHIHISDN